MQFNALHASFFKFPAYLSQNSLTEGCLRKVFFVAKKHTLIRCKFLIHFFAHLPQNSFSADKTIVFNVKTPRLVLIFFGIINSYSRTGDKRITALAGTDPDGVSAKVDTVMLAAGNSQRLTEFSGTGGKVGRIFAFAPAHHRFQPGHRLQRTDQNGIGGSFRSGPTTLN